MLRSFLVSFLFIASYQLSAQNSNESVLEEAITVQKSGLSIPATLRQIDKLSDVKFSYNSNIVPRDIKITNAYFNTSIRTILTEILGEANLYFREVSGTVIILKRVYSERKIVGQVLDDVTKEPLQYVNVFIERSTFGAATDINGDFQIENIPDIGFNLVVSYVGYKTKVIPFNYRQDVENSKYIIEMKIDPVVLESIQVVGKARKRFKRDERKLLKRFTTEFLGRSENAKNCVIENPEVLNFEILDDDNYRVTADAILYVQNRALGYRIGYLLEEFRFENGLKLNIGSAKFQELEVKSRKRYTKWEIARDKAYNGSVQHFLNAMITNSLDKEGFELNLVQYDSVTSEYTTPLNPPPANEILTLNKTDQEYLYTLHANSDVEVTYKGEYEESAYKKLYRSTSKSGNYKYTDKKVKTSIALTETQNLSSYQVFGVDVTDVDLFQKSIIFFLEDDTPVGFPGQFKNPRDMLFGGWWRWGAFSDWLPLNYKPD